VEAAATGETANWSGSSSPPPRSQALLRQHHDLPRGRWAAGGLPSEAADQERSGASVSSESVLHRSRTFGSVSRNLISVQRQYKHTHRQGGLDTSFATMTTILLSPKRANQPTVALLAMEGERLLLPARQEAPVPSLGCAARHHGDVRHRGRVTVEMRAPQAGSVGSAHPAASAVAAAVGAEEPPSTGRRATAERREPSGARREAGGVRSPLSWQAGCSRRRSIMKKETRLRK
jgi:hypothetical protein